MKILLTGYTGNIGYEIAKQLAGHEVLAWVRDLSTAPVMEHVVLLSQAELAQARDCEVIIHSAADTTFNSPLESLKKVNVGMTQHLLDFATECPDLRRFVQVSTACACGTSGGVVPEAALPRPPGFVNAYEQSKWEAEQRVLASGLPSCIARLSIVAGSEVDGAVRRKGALHHLLFWLWKGLVPMIPGTADTLVDLISTEHAARGIVASALGGDVPPFIQICAGSRAPRLGELLQQVAQDFSNSSTGWKRGAISSPEIVDAATFALFEQTVLQSGDLLFQRVCTDAKSFLPGLLHPRVYATELAESLHPETAYDWRKLSTLVTHHVPTRYHA